MLTLRLFTSLLLLLTVATTVLAESNHNSTDYGNDSFVADYLDYLHSHADYYDYSVYYEPDLRNVTLRKCFCNSDQIWNGTACQTHETYVVIYDYHTAGTFLVNTSDFGNVSIGEVSCPTGTARATLGNTSSQTAPFYILETGELGWYNNTIVNYCLEHIYGKTVERDEWFAEICLQPPTIPSCCPEGQVVDGKGFCVDSSTTYNFLPSVRVSDQMVTWPAIVSEKVEDISCTTSEELFLLELNNSTVALEYTHVKPSLSWTSPIVIRDYPIDLNYCIGVNIDIEEKPIYIAKLCYKDPFKDHLEKCKGKTCVRKCCEDSKITSNNGCILYPSHNGTQVFQPVFHDPLSFSEVDEPENLTYVHGMPLCNDYFQLRPHEGSDDDFFLLSNGYLHASAFPEPYPPTKYCIDSFLDFDNEIRMLPLVCFHDNDKPSQVCENVQKYLYPVLLIISIGFLAITLMVYLCVPELHAKVHGKCLLSHVTALLMAYISLFIVQRTTKTLSPFGCRFMASVTHFSFLSAFFWLNVMCFDIWWTLKSMRPVPETGELSRLRFKLYSLYSWGCPLIITVVSVIIQSLPEEVDVIRPNFGRAKCWFSDNVSLWAYFYGFVLVLVTANILFFCQVAYILIVAQNDPILQRTRQQDRERMWLYVKLFLVMGITWLAEVISWQEGTCELWIITDIINSLQGVSIFLIFICKRNLLKKVRGKWEPYLRHVKEVVGSRRLTRFSTSGTRTTAREHLSFSSSENRPNHSAASHGTVQSQLSVDPTSVNRKLSTSSLNATTGVQVHTQNSVPMDSIAESSHPDDDMEKAVPVEDSKEEQVTNNNIQTTDDKTISSPKDSKELPDPAHDDTSHTQNSINVNLKENGIISQEQLSDNEKTTVESTSSRKCAQDDTSNVKLAEKTDGEHCEISINASIIPVHNPKESSYGETDFAYTHTQANPGFLNDEDEPVHV